MSFSNSKRFQKDAETERNSDSFYLRRDHFDNQ